MSTTAPASENKHSPWNILKDTVKAFSNDNAMKMAASLSYYTVFAIGPLLLMIITLTGLFISQSDVRDLLNDQLNGFLGETAAKTIDDIVVALQNQNKDKAFTFAIVGGITLFLGSTGIFLEIQDSINTIWCIKAKPKKGWLKFITNRLLSFSLIVGMGFLLMVSLLINTLTDALTSRIAHYFGAGESIFLQVVSSTVLFVVISLLFSVIFKVLPDAKIHWKDTIVGACFTGLLFLIGKFAIGAYIGSSNLDNTYGAAASVIILLTWVYYSSIILYFGAEFTKEWAMHRGKGISPNDTAVLIEKREVELHGKKHAGPNDIPVEVRG